MLSPRFDEGVASDAELESVLTGFVNAFIVLAYKASADHLKLHLGSAADRMFLRALASKLSDQGLKAHVGGAWLEMRNLKERSDA